MKRTIFTIIMVLLFGAFASFYSIPFLRESFISVVPQIENVYLAMDEFFLKIWKVVFESWINIDYTHHPELPGTVIVGLSVLVIVLLVVLISSIIGSSRRNRKARFDENIKNELEKLESKDAPSEFTHYDVNNVVFANEKTPLVTLENELIVSSKVNEEQANALLNAKKAKPLWRTILSVIYVIFLGFIIFLRIIYHHHYSAEPTFAFILENETVKFLFDNFDRFFDSLVGGLKGTPIFTMMEATWYVEELVEYLVVFLIGILILTLALLVCHLILKKNRKSRNLKRKINSLTKYKEGDISNKNLSFFGYADTRDVKGDVRTIAKLTNSEAKETRERDMYKRASYIDDISEGVNDKGVVNLGGFVIEPSPVRKSLVNEAIEEDLSMNENVTLEDIVSIEDKSEDVVNIDKIESFVVPDEGVNYVDPNYVDINIIASTDCKNEINKETLEVDDTLVFDEDGYGYLVKEGKNFIDDEEDISDIIELDELDKSAIIDRFGENYYSLLNDLEPFHLHRLNYDEEMERINGAREDGKLVVESNKQYEELSKEEFKETEGFVEPVEEAEVTEEVTEEENKPTKLQDPLEGIRKERPKIVPISIHEDNGEETEVKKEPLETVSEETETEEVHKLADPRNRDGRKPIKPITPIAIHKEEDKTEEVQEEVQEQETQEVPVVHRIVDPRNRDSLKPIKPITPVLIHEQEEVPEVTEVKEVTEETAVVESNEERKIEDPRHRGDHSSIKPIEIRKVPGLHDEEEPEVDNEPKELKKGVTPHVKLFSLKKRDEDRHIELVDPYHREEKHEIVPAQLDNKEDTVDTYVEYKVQEEVEPSNEQTIVPVEIEPTKQDVNTYTEYKTEEKPVERTVVVPVEIESPEKDINTYTEFKTEETEPKEETKKEIRIIRRPIVPVNIKLRKDEETVKTEPVIEEVYEEEVVEEERKLKDPLAGKRKAKPTITPIAIKIKREEEVKPEPKSDVVNKVKLCKFTKPRKRPWIKKEDIKPLSLEGKRVTNSNTLVYMSQDDSVMRPVSPLEAFNKGVTVAIPSYKTLLDKPDAPIATKPRKLYEDFFEEDGFDDLIDNDFAMEHEEPNVVKKVQLKRFKKKEVKIPKPLSKRKHSISQLVKHSKPNEPVEAKTVDYSKFIKTEK